MPEDAAAGAGELQERAAQAEELERLRRAGEARDLDVCGARRAGRARERYDLDRVVVAILEVN